MCGDAREMTNIIEHLKIFGLTAYQNSFYYKRDVNVDLCLDIGNNNGIVINYFN